jgi:hypothetical protein
MKIRKMVFPRDQKINSHGMEEIKSMTNAG